MSGLPAWPYPRLGAHRGAGKRAPENTLASLRFGHARGYRMAEIDVKLSADGVARRAVTDELTRFLGASSRSSMPAVGIRRHSRAKRYPRWRALHAGRAETASRSISKSSRPRGESARPALP
jgi:glycerophosphoryl diester phosphodiesterase